MLSVVASLRLLVSQPHILLGMTDEIDRLLLLLTQPMTVQPQQAVSGEAGEAGEAVPVAAVGESSAEEVETVGSAITATAAAATDDRPSSSSNNTNEDKGRERDNEALFSDNTAGGTADSSSPFVSHTRHEVLRILKCAVQQPLPDAVVSHLHQQRSIVLATHRLVEQVERLCDRWIRRRGQRSGGRGPTRTTGTSIGTRSGEDTLEFALDVDKERQLISSIPSILSAIVDMLESSIGALADQSSSSSSTAKVAGGGDVGRTDGGGGGGGGGGPGGGIARGGGKWEASSSSAASPSSSSAAGGHASTHRSSDWRRVGGGAGGGSGVSGRFITTTADGVPVLVDDFEAARGYELLEGAILAASCLDVPLEPFFDIVSRLSHLKVEGWPRDSAGNRSRGGNGNGGESDRRREKGIGGGRGGNGGEAAATVVGGGGGGNVGARGRSSGGNGMMNGSGMRDSVVGARRGAPGTVGVGVRGESAVTMAMFQRPGLVQNVKGFAVRRRR